jgi:hypothetical protein
MMDRKIDSAFPMKSVDGSASGVGGAIVHRDDLDGQRERPETIHHSINGPLLVVGGDDHRQA